MPKPPPEIGSHFGRSDQERYGIFAEMEYLHGRGYTYPIRNPQIRDPKGAQMFPGYPKWKSAVGDCYFDPEFKRLFEGERWIPMYKFQNQERLKMKPLIKTEFKPSSYTHLHSTPGDYFGCFTGQIDAFDPRAKKQPKKEKEDKSKKLQIFIYSSPGKKGGCGYKDITIGTYPEYIPTVYEAQKKRETKKDRDRETVWRPVEPGKLFQSNPYECESKFWVTYKKKNPAKWSLYGVFRPPSTAKWDGGCKDGCFSPFPDYSINRYIDPWKIPKKIDEILQKRKEKAGLIPKTTKKDVKGQRLPEFIPQARNKSFPTYSVINKNIHIATNAKNWKTMKPVTFTREFIG